MMDQEKLKQLLTQTEGPNLDFKQVLHGIYAEDRESKKRQTHEFIKDILSLANGNASVAGEPAYLIIGAADTPNVDGSRDLYDVGDKVPEAEAIQQMVNAMCSPRLDHIEAHLIWLEGKRIFVVTIPASPHVYETTRKLETPRQIFTEHVVLIRHGANISVASAKERAALLELKQIRFTEARNVPPIQFGIGVGSITCGAFGVTWAEILTGRTEDKIVGGFVGAILGGLAGCLVGAYYSQFQLLRTELRVMPKHWRIPAIIGFTGVNLGLVKVSNIISRKLMSVRLSSLFTKERQSQ